MDSITINNLQNEAQNMIIGSKQHSLFAGVTNNPSLLSKTDSCCVSSQHGLETQVPQIPQVSSQGSETPPEVRSVKISGPAGSIEAIAVADRSEINDVIGFGSNAATSHNRHLYGMLSPCGKQYGRHNG